MPAVKERIERVRDYRASSDSPDTRKFASMPMEWHVTFIPDDEYLAIPNVSSERRDYIPIGWLAKEVIPNQKLRVLTEASLWEFGILSSAMHMGWMRAVTGRLETRYMYSVGVVYNTFPWPDASEAQRDKVAALAQAVLDARANHPTANLAQLYDPLTMPADLRAAHQALDRAVDRLYRPEPFSGDADRVALLFTRYAALVDPLATSGARANARVARRAAKSGPSTGSG